MRGRGGRALFLVMQVLEIPAGGRAFPLVIIILLKSNQPYASFLINSIHKDLGQRLMILHSLTSCFEKALSKNRY